MSFFAELKRRNVIRMAGLYLVGAWLIIQIAETLLPAFDVPGWVLRAVIILLAIGFLPALLISWLFELTPDGLKRDAEVDPAQSIAPATAQRMDRLILVGLAAAILVVAADRFWPRTDLPMDATSTAASTQPDATDAAAVAMDEAVATPGNSIAVLPFVNMSADPEQEYFSDGLSEEILNLLAQIRDLKVIGRTSSFAFKGRNEDLRTIGNTLGVAYLLEGSVRKAGDDLRITAQLIEVEGGSHLWSQSYDRKLENVFAIQTEIAGSIAEALKMSLIGPDQAAPVAQTAASLSAYELFLQARRLIQGRTPSGLEAARKLLDAALALDPDYAPALAAAAQAALFQIEGIGGYGDMSPDQAAAIAQPLLDRALALDPKLAEAHAVQGLLFRNAKYDNARAEASLDRALALNPSLSDALHWRALLLLDAGRLREELAARRQLAEIDPLNVANLSSLGWNLWGRGNLVEAELAAVRLQRAFPDSPMGFVLQAAAWVQSGRLADARVPVALALGLAPEDAFAGLVSAWNSYALGDFERVLSLQATPVHAPALIALGRIDEAVATARERSTAAPEDRAAAETLLFTLSQAGRNDEVLAMFGERWGDPNGLDAYFGTIGSGVLSPLAIAQQALGQQQALDKTLAHWRKRLDFMREQGNTGQDFRTGEARYLALAGEHAAALTALTKTIDQGWRDPLLARDLAFAQLQNDPAFKAQVSRMIDLINTERAKLDMGPLP